MAAPERFAEMPDFSLALRAPSIHGTSRRFAAPQNLVAIGGSEHSLRCKSSGRYWGHSGETNVSALIS